MTSKVLIIPAAGSGSRMHTSIPKPFLQLADRTILAHTIRKFLFLEGLKEVVVATSGQYLSKVRHMLNAELPDQISGRCLEGGANRQESVFKALQQSSEAEFCIIHDAVRPFVKKDHIKKCCQKASQMAAVVLGIPVKDTIKQVDENKIVQKTPDRRSLWQVQTPQIFEKGLIIKAHQKAQTHNFEGTDDASLVEQLGEKVKMVRGDHENIKITYPVDLKLAELLIGEKYG